MVGSCEKLLGKAPLWKGSCSCGLGFGVENRGLELVCEIGTMARQSLKARAGPPCFPLSANRRLTDLPRKGGGRCAAASRGRDIDQRRHREHAVASSCGREVSQLGYKTWRLLAWGEISQPGTEKTRRLCWGYLENNVPQPLLRICPGCGRDSSNHPPPPPGK